MKLNFPAIRGQWHVWGNTNLWRGKNWIWANFPSLARFIYTVIFRVIKRSAKWNQNPRILFHLTAENSVAQLGRWVPIRAFGFHFLATSRSRTDPLPQASCRRQKMRKATRQSKKTGEADVSSSSVTSATDSKDYEKRIRELESENEAFQVVIHFVLSFTLFDHSEIGINNWIRYCFFFVMLVQQTSIRLFFMRYF